MIEEAAIRLDRVDAAYGRNIALEGVDLVVPRGALVAIIGPNGAGKSTLLKVIAGLHPIRFGAARVLGQPPGHLAGRVAYVPQSDAIDWAFPVTVGDVAMMGRYPAIGIGRRPGPVDREHVDHALETVAMTAWRHRQIGALSGGQRRRAFLAKALAAAPDLYLLDEPVTGVDATTQDALMDVLESEARAGRTVVATTHDLVCAAYRFHDAVLMNRRVVGSGPARDVILDQERLEATYGGHVLVVPGAGNAGIVVVDAHVPSESIPG